VLSRTDGYVLAVGSGDAVDCAERTDPVGHDLGADPVEAAVAVAVSGIRALISLHVPT